VNGQTYTRGVVADLLLPGLDRPALVVALGPWAQIFEFAERHGARYVIAAGVLGADEAAFSSIELYADDVLAAVHYAHAHLGELCHVDGGATRWTLFADPQLRGVLFGALGLHAAGPDGEA